MQVCFGDIVVVRGDQIGVVVKSWLRNGREKRYEIYVRNDNNITEFPEEEVERYIVRHKELNEEEIGYQRIAVLGY